MFLIKKLSINTMPDFTRNSVPRFFANNLVKIILRCVHFEYLTHYKFLCIYSKFLKFFLKRQFDLSGRRQYPFQAYFYGDAGREPVTQEWKSAHNSWVWIVPWQQILSKMLSIMIGCLFSKYLHVNRENACTTLVCYSLFEKQYLTKKCL